MTLSLHRTKRTDSRLLSKMSTHYSQPKGFVGRSIFYAVEYDGIYYGHIGGGSATRFLSGRNEFLGITIKELNNVVNNIFYSIGKVGDGYPVRNFTSLVVEGFVNRIKTDWADKYGDTVKGFETLVEKPRTGELYRRAGWNQVGETKGFTCKRVAGKGTDSWGGKRVWNTDSESLRPKIILCLRV